MYEFDLGCPANSGQSVLIHLLGQGSSNEFAVILSSLLGAMTYDYTANNGTNRMHVVYPFYNGQLIDTTVLRVEAHTYASGVSTTLSITNFNAYRPDLTTIADATAQLIQSQLFSSNVMRNTYSSLRLRNTSGQPSYDGQTVGNAEFYGAQPLPAAFNPRMGDRVINYRPQVGQPKAWSYALAAGATTPGAAVTAVSEGNL